MALYDFVIHIYKLAAILKKVDSQGEILWKKYKISNEK